MTLRITNNIAGGLQITLCVFLLLWFVLLLMDEGPTASFTLGEYNGNRGVRTHGSIPLTVIVFLLSLFTLITGLVHIFAYGTPSTSYTGDVDRGNNWIRWCEYAITATIMLFVIAVLSGVGSTDTLILITVSTICCMFSGFISEATAREPGDRKLSKLATFMGWILMLASFGVILRRFGSIVSQAQSTGSPGPPSFVWAIVIGMLILYMSFGVIHAVHMHKQWTSVVPVDSVFHRRIDNAYTIVSMVSKTLLVVLVASGLFAVDRHSNSQGERQADDATGQDKGSC